MAEPVAIADTSALIAFFNEADKHHQAVRAGLAQVGHLVVSPCVLAELDYLIATRQGPHAAREVLAYSPAASREAVGRRQPSGPCCLRHTRSSTITRPSG